MAWRLGFRPVCLLHFVMEPAAAQRDPETPGGRKPESASGGVSPGAGPDSWPGEQEEDQQDRDSGSSGQLQGERLPRAPAFMNDPACDWLTSATLLSPLGGEGRREGEKAPLPPAWTKNWDPVHALLSASTHLPSMLCHLSSSFLLPFIKHSLRMRMCEYSSVPSPSVNGACT